MIPPVTGNGMSMAFESAEIATPLLAAYSRNEASWPEVRQQIARECDEAFASRLRWARLLQRGLFHASVRAALGFAAAHPGAWSRGLFAKTR
jgi:menaquinone-9 beta-reductase